MATQVPAVRAEQSLIDLLNKMLCHEPEWIARVYDRTCELVREALHAVPAQLERDSKHLSVLQQKENHLITALEDGKTQLSAVQKRLAELEAERSELEKRVQKMQSLQPQAADLPDREWLEEQLCQWTGTLHQDQQRAALVLRQAIGEIRVSAIIAPGKKRGYAQMTFRMRGWPALRSFLNDRLPTLMAATTVADCSAITDESPEFTVDLGAPTSMDRWGPQIAVWRAQGVKWLEIVERTGLDLNRAYIAWKRFTDNVPAETA